MLHRLFAHQRSLLTFLTFLAALSQAVIIIPQTEILQDAANQGRAPECFDDDNYGKPLLNECKAAVSSFIGVISGRRFAFDQPIEFLDLDTRSLHADKYPRQPVTEAGDYHTFTGRISAKRTCILRFFMLEPLDDNPEEPASSISTYGDFLGAARNLLDACVSNHKGGVMPIRAQGRDISVSMEEGTRGDPVDTLRIAMTRSYQPNEIDKVLLSSNSIGFQAPATGILDQGSSAGSGNLVPAPMYCSTQQSHATNCEPGSSCQAIEADQDNELSEVQRWILWGDVIAKLMSMSGTCAGEFMI